VPLPARHHGPRGEAEATAELAEAPRAPAGETVLVVDDEPTVRMLVADVLSELGYAAVEAGDGASGLAVLRSERRLDLLGDRRGPARRHERAAAGRGGAGGAAGPAGAVHHGLRGERAGGNGQLEPGMRVMTKPFSVDALARRIRDMLAKA
jgi:hypothetical protein